jgi:hypothetical protein
VANFFYRPTSFESLKVKHDALLATVVYKKLMVVVESMTVSLGRFERWQPYPQTPSKLDSSARDLINSSMPTHSNHIGKAFLQRTGRKVEVQHWFSRRAQDLHVGQSKHPISKPYKAATTY